MLFNLLVCTDRMLEDNAHFTCVLSLLYAGAEEVEVADGAPSKVSFVLFNCIAVVS